MELAAYIALIVLGAHSIMQDLVFCRVSGQRLSTSYIAPAACVFGVIAIVLYIA